MPREFFIKNTKLSTHFVHASVVFMHASGHILWIPFNKESCIWRDNFMPSGLKLGHLGMRIQLFWHG